MFMNLFLILTNYCINHASLFIYCKEFSSLVYSFNRSPYIYSMYPKPLNRSLIFSLSSSE